jgi:hypothetical protein
VETVRRGKKSASQPKEEIMAEAAGGRVPPYGTAINDALKDPQTSLDELIAHRDHAREVLAAQGDLKSALERLEAEIGRRGGGGSY